MDAGYGPGQDTIQVEKSSSGEEDNNEAEVTMARRSQCSDAGDNPLDPNYLPPHYREEYRMAIDALVEEDVDGYYKFLQLADVVDFLSLSEIDYIQNSVQVPNQLGHPEHQFLDTGGDGSSDTYWPMHSDLDAPGLDLGWPQTHHLIGPTEVTTLVNPAAPDMPSIKEQARRLIKNAQMVIAIVMDMFTDVDIFADILNAAMRNVAVYILLDEANVDHFIKMVNNCRVNLQSIQFLRVRTVSGITYHSRSGKSFKGQMLDRFIFTDCRAVLSGNYSFMWSYEKLHRCMAHLFLGQLVSTFDEEFRILFAQSEPLIIENMEDINILQKPPYPGERPMLRDTRKYRTMDTAHPEDWPRQPYDERVDMDWRMMPLKRQETFHGPVDVYNRYPSPQTRLEPQFDQGPPRMPMMEGLAHKRHSFAEAAPGRYNPPYQQGLPEVEPPGRPYYRGQPLHPGQVHEPDYGGYNKGGYDKFWNQDFHQEEQYPEPGFPQEIEPHEGYDPVMNYLSSTRTVDIDQSSDKLIPGPDLPYATTHPRRSKGHAYACQTSPTPSNTTEKKLFQEHIGDRKDPTVKRGLRNWRISSYLSAYDSSGEPEGLPMGPGQATDPFEEFSNPTQQPTPPPPPVVEITGPKIPNVREFKVPTLPRASQMPAFATSRDLPKKLPDEPPQYTVPVLYVQEPTKTTPTPSESSSTTDGEKQDEVEPREPKAPALRREDSFRRNYNAAVPRSSRLRSSLIFSSLDQNTSQDNSKTVPGEQEGEGTKMEGEQTKLPFVSQVLAQRRSGARDPFEWKSYIKTTDNAKTEEDSGKQAEKDSTTNSKLDTLSERQEALKPQDQAPNVLLPKPSQIEPPKMEPLPPPAPQQPSKSFLNEPFLDMNDPDQRLMFFKELAAKRRATKAAEEAKLKHESDSKVKKDEHAKEDKDVAGSSKQDSKKPIDDAKKTEANTQEVSGTIDKPETVVKQDPAPTPSCEKIEMKVATDSEKYESKQSQVSLPVSTEKQIEAKQPKLEIKIPKPAVQQDKPIDPPIATTPANVEQVTEEKTTSEATSKGPQLKASTSVPDFGKMIGSDLLSSLPSSRIYERSMSQEKDIQPKSRLWSPLLHKRELLKPYSDSKQKSMSTVIQIEESPEEPSQTAKSDLASATAKSQSQMSDTTQSKPPQNESTSCETENKESIKEKFSVLPAISEKEQPQIKKTLVRSLSSGTQVKVDTEEPTKSFTSTQAPTQDKSKILPFTLDKTQPHKEGTEFPTQPLPGKETLNKQSLVKSTASEDCKDASKGATQLQSTALPCEKTQQHQPENKESSVKSSGEKIKESDKMPGPSQSKTEPKQSLDQTKKEKSISSVVGDRTQKPYKLQSVVSTGQETSSSTSPPISEKTELQEPAKQHTEKAAEKTSVEVDEGTEKSSQTGTNSAISQENLVKLPAASEKADAKQSDKETITETKQMATSSDKVTTEKTAQVHTAEEKSSPVTQKEDLTREAIQTPDTSLASQCDSKEPEKSRSNLPSDKIDVVEVPQTIEEAKLKFPITCTEEIGQLESHSNTSSPASFATALEFISSEDSDIFSPAKTDPNHLFKTGNLDYHSSSVSDLSDFETPSSDLSRSPMPATNLDETSEDNISVAETVIEAAPRRISASTDGVKVDIEPTKPSLESQQSLTQDATIQPSTPQSDSPSPNEKSNSEKSTEEATTQIEVSPATTQVTKEVKVEKQQITTETTTKETSTQKESEEADSTDVKTNDLTSQSETKAATSSATSQEKQNTKMPVTTKDISKPTEETSLENKTEVSQMSTDVKDQGIDASTVKSESETKPVSSNTSPATSQEANMPDKVPDSTTALSEKSNKENKTEASRDSQSADVESQDVTSKSETKIATQSPTSQDGSEVKQETKIMVDKTSEITTKETSKPEDKSKASNTTDTNVKNKDLEAPNKSISSEKAADQVRQNISEPANVKTNETAPPSQPKQSKPAQSRYLSSTANVISSSNLRDDTKILLEQISANSQNRNESSTTKEAPVTDDEKEDEADKNAKRKKENELKIKSLSQQKPSQDRDKLLERIQTMRSNRKVYSRFEV